MPQENLYNKYGGYQTVKNITIDFYDRILKQKTLAHYFVNVPIDKLIEHQTKFICQVIGGPAHYSGRELKKAHGPLSITLADFNLVAKILQESLLAGGMSSDDTAKVMAIVATTKDDIVASAQG